MKKNFRAFTLIEMLIVVAIIGVLVGIAVPNYQTALVKSKVARFERDARTAEHGLEAYYVDHAEYPRPDPYSVPSDCLDGFTDPPDTVHEGYLPRLITTPVAYLNDLPMDVFENGELVGPCHPDARTYIYSADNYNEFAFNYYYVSDLYHQLSNENVTLGAQPSNAQYLVASPGPDQDSDIGRAELGDAADPVEYDPTNGVNSNGDLMFFGPGIGFPDDR